MNEYSEVDSPLSADLAALTLHIAPLVGSAHGPETETFLRGTMYYNPQTGVWWRQDESTGRWSIASD